MLHSYICGRIVTSVSVGERRVGTGSTIPPNTAGLNRRGGWYWIPSPHSHHPHSTTPNPSEPPTSIRLPPRLPTHLPPDCRRGNNLQANQHNVFSDNDFHPVHRPDLQSKKRKSCVQIRVFVFLIYTSSIIVSDVVIGV